MRNLKRVLSLALALVMIIGMMIVGAGAASADFGDGAKIKNVEAVDVLVGLEVLEGDDKDNFNPTDILTREQAAKMITYMVLGTKNAEAVSKNKVVVFNDVAAERWSAGFIAWCYNQGILAGNGDGSFAPTEPLTGVAYAKMLLTALGYDAAVEGYVNNINWATNIGADAIAAGLDLKGELLASPLTRDNAAQMTFQALTADVVEYEDKGMEIITADGTVIRAGVKGPYAVEAEKDDDNYTNTKAGKDTIQLVEKLYPEVKKVVKDGHDDWGNPYEYKWVEEGARKDTVLYTEYYDVVAEYFTAVADCDIIEELGEDDDTDYTLWVDGEDDPDAEWAEKNHEAKDNGTGTGVWTRIYDTAEGYVAVCINTYMAIVTDLVDEEADRNGHGAYKGIELELAVKDEEGKVVGDGETLEFETDAEFEEDQYVLVNKLYDGTVKAVVDAESELGTVTRVKYATDPAVMATITADGVKYGQNVKYVGEDPEVKADYDLWFDLYGNIIMVTDPGLDDAATAWGVITAIKWVDKNDVLEDGYAKANIITMDGDDEAMAGVELVYDETNDTALEYAYDDATGAYADGNVATSTQANKAGWTDILLQYEVNKDGSYDIADKAQESDLDTIIAGTKNVVADGEGYARTNSKTVYLVKTMDGKKAVYTSYTGFKNVPSMEDVKNVQYVTKKGYVSFMYVDATSATFLGETDLVYFVSTDVIGWDNDLEWFEGYVGTDNVEFFTEEVDDLGLTTGLFEVKYDSEGVVIKVEAKGTYMDTIDYCDGDVMEDWESDKLVDSIDVSNATFYKFNKKGAVVSATYKDVDSTVIVVLDKKGDAEIVYCMD